MLRPKRSRVGGRRKDTLVAFALSCKGACSFAVERMYRLPMVIYLGSSEHCASSAPEFERFVVTFVESDQRTVNDA